jgi:Delta24-sterol reductase
MDSHQSIISILSTQIRDFHSQKIPFRIQHGSTNSTRPSTHRESQIIDTSKLNHVISIDSTSKTAIVEPNVAMDELVKATLLHSMIPAVVPEFPGITAGGAFSGTAAESSSFKHGYFDSTVNWIEIILGNGSIQRASRTERSELFFGAAGALGTLGVISLLELQLIDCPSHTLIEYTPVYSIGSMLREIDDIVKSNKKDFVDAILFTSSAGVVITGSLKSERIGSTPQAQFSTRDDPWFAFHAHSKICHLRDDLNCVMCNWAGKKATKNPPLAESVPIEDYLFRFDRGSFWLGAYGWPKFLFNRCGRYILDDMFRTRFAYRVLHHAGTSQRFIIQDLAIPLDKAKEMISWLDQELAIYPLWLCPIKNDTKVLMHNCKVGVAESPASYLNIGVWGLPRHGKSFYRNKDHDRFVHDNRKIEAQVSTIGGLKWLYAVNFYTEAEFWDVYDKCKYEAIREDWQAGTLPNIWDKTKRLAIERKTRHIITAFLKAASNK